jgi:hypothetical protein
MRYIIFANLRYAHLFLAVHEDIRYKGKAIRVHNDHSKLQPDKQQAPTTKDKETKRKSKSK